MANETPGIGERIRTFLRQLFGSRLTSHLEDELFRLRSDYEVRLRDRDHYISDLKSDIERLRAKVAEYELVLIPLTSGGLLGPRPPRQPLNTLTVDETGSWAAEQARWYREQEDAAAREAKEHAGG